MSVPPPRRAHQAHGACPQGTLLRSGGCFAPNHFALDGALNQRFAAAQIVGGMALSCPMAFRESIRRSPQDWADKTCQGDA
jgi:hypothetical protein